MLLSYCRRRAGGRARPFAHPALACSPARRAAGVDLVRLLVAAGVLLAGGGLAALAVYTQVQDGGRLRELVNRLRDPLRVREELGSAHFCYPASSSGCRSPRGSTSCGCWVHSTASAGAGDEAKRFYRLDRGPNRNNRWPWIALSVEDQARGICLIGPPGTGKSQAGILPISADSMKSGQLLIVLDPQGELAPHLPDYARVTGHLVILHDPTDDALPGSIWRMG
jgi:hypothetical protein